MTKLEFDRAASVLSGRLVSSDRQARIEAANEAIRFVATLPPVLKNSPHIKGEIDALLTLIERAEND